MELSQKQISETRSEFLILVHYPVSKVLAYESKQCLEPFFIDRVLVVCGDEESTAKSVTNRFELISLLYEFPVGKNDASSWHIWEFSAQSCAVLFWQNVS